LEIVRNNLFLNIPIAVEDIMRTESIFGKYLREIKGKKNKDTTGSCANGLCHGAAQHYGIS
jgi:hypothetical protein